ncbi:hypothetical protein LSPCS325_24810 [Lysinibacillus sp. CTST325]
MKAKEENARFEAQIALLRTKNEFLIKLELAESVLSRRKKKNKTNAEQKSQLIYTVIKKGIFIFSSVV